MTGGGVRGDAGESKHADIGTSLPAPGEAPTAPVFVDGKKDATLKGAGIAVEFNRMVAEYIEGCWGG